MFEKALAQGRPLLLDGGLATELESRGFDLRTDLWSAALLQDNPQAIVDAHRAYLDAGANCLISASYQASRQGFMALGLSAAEADASIAGSVLLAGAAREQYLKGNPDSAQVPLVAASIGPFGAVRHDGSEYTGDYGLSRDEMTAFHKPRLELLDATDADVLACETIPNFVEAQVLCELLMTARCPAWVSFSCRDGHRISDGTPLKDATGIFRQHPRVLAVGVNCTAPQHIVSLIAQAKAGAPDKAIVVYANSGETYDARSNTWSGTVTPIECGAAAKAWRAAGATLIGGCCRMGPRHIAAMKGALA